MCGIAGFSGAFEPSLLNRMSTVIGHRGPDDADALFIADSSVGLAHRRLSIIDLSSAGRQPMWDTTRTACIVFNGEIYNYRELRRELERDGFEFRNHTDTEVILNLYKREGAAILPRLNGIFAFALWDSRSRSLLVARDGLGVKPLYYAKTANGFVFASELKAVLQAPGVARSLDVDAVAGSKCDCVVLPRATSGHLAREVCEAVGKPLLAMIENATMTSIASLGSCVSPA